MNDAVWLAVVTSLSTLIMQLMSMYKEYRQRRWDIEDRERARAELAAKVVQSQEEVAKRTDEQTKAIVDKIDENTAMNDKALREAAELKERYSALALFFDRVSVDEHINRVMADKLPEIQHTVEDTNQIVRGMQKDADDKT